MIKYNELFRMLKMDGWYEIWQKGSHVIMKHPSKTGRLIVSFHGEKEVRQGLLKTILNQAKIKK